MYNPLVSIIIPTYNRAHLIVETLNAILAQTYTHWECIIVDDGSTDASEILIKQYCDSDSRISLYHRPKERPKGANACRNYGLEMSKGTLINWFDSDDYMLPTFLEQKVSVLLKGSYDFVISNAVDWDGDQKETPIYEVSNKGKDINAFNFITQHINCITNDFMATKASIASLGFNELLKSGQEYNFISRYLCTTTKGAFITKILSKRRVHAESIQSNVSKMMAIDQDAYHKRTVENKFLLLEDITTIGDDKSKLYLVNSIISFSYRLAQKKQDIPFFNEIVKHIKIVKSPKSARYYYAAVKGVRYTGKGYQLYKKALS
ncbi:glycosyltransferase family 2 protein [Patiriisocius sp. Uisw_017]|jgi:glycosyltransferase involved in cell wall biosynthesis|uniref:glycosyltransferase family 2 protein n=1 Tax=Patiriisocius sp. Uisw_017 TaxID=3230968 RepID=UPI0039EA8A59